MSGRETIHEAVYQLEPRAGARVSIRELQGKVSLSKCEFDREILSLVYTGKVGFHQHADFSVSSSEALVADARGSYMGIVLRGAL